MPFTEKQLTSLFSKFMRKDGNKQLPFSFAVEFKVKKNKETLNLVSGFEPQQIPMLLQAQEENVYHKISDMSRASKPFDSFNLRKVRSFVGIMWYKPRKPKILYLIPIIVINHVLENLSPPRFSENMAKNFADFTIKLK